MQDAIQFTKMHGAGNDYVFVDCRAGGSLLDDLARVAREASDRHTGIGGDGLILIEDSAVADVRMRMFNADGSEGQMCGNGIRCIAKYLFDRRLIAGRRARIESAAGVVDTEISRVDDAGRAVRICVTLLQPILNPDAIPTTLPGSPPLDLPLETSLGERRVNCISMGNPHCVLYCDDLSDGLVATLGPELESHAAFPERVNVGFCRVLSRNAVMLRVWERGSGETRACGSGACAAAVLGQLRGQLAESVTVDLPGGQLEVAWQRGAPVRLTGPAVEVFSGSWNRGLEHIL